MKWLSLILLLSLAFTLVLPPSVCFSLAQDDQPLLVAFKVCGSAVPAISAQGDIPCLSEVIFGPAPCFSDALAQEQRAHFSEAVPLFRIERPPQS